MRWEIKTKTSDEVKSTTSTTQTLERTTTTTKTQYITVGDIVGMAKSMAGAVKNIVRKIPSYINTFKKDGNIESANLAQTCLNIATPLAAIIQGTEVYKKATTVINTLTPIVKLVARGTGVWCSPGNAADIANIVLGTVQQILIALITQAIIALKDWVWNFEFKFREITSEASTLITKNLKKTAKILQSIAAGALNYDNLDPENTSNYNANSSTQKALKTAYDELNSIVGDPSAPEGFTEELVDAILQSMGLASSTYSRFGNSWITVYKLNNTILREFRGSINDKGIQYTALENGKIVWKQSSKTDGSFCCFNKITVNNQVIYVAASCPYYTYDNATKLKSESDWDTDDYGQYNKDYYKFRTISDANQRNDNLVKVTKTEKDSKDMLTMWSEQTSLYSMSGGKPAVGIWYSLNNGESWIQSNITAEYIGNIFEFEEKTNYPNTLVAASYDYKGLYYSTDGKTWTNSKLEGETFNHGRVVSLYDYKNEKIRTTSYGLEVNASIKANAGVLGYFVNDKTKASAEFTSPTVEVYEGGVIARTSYIKEILDYIHENYWNYNNNNFYFADYKQTFWEGLITEIVNNTYTMADAKNGKYFTKEIKHE